MFIKMEVLSVCQVYIYYPTKIKKVHNHFGYQWYQVCRPKTTCCFSTYNSNKNAKRSQINTEIQNKETKR